MVARLVIVGLIFLVGAGAIARATTGEPTPMRESFNTFPREIDGWTASPGTPFDEKVLAILGVDEYVNLIYSRPKETSIGVYIGYYRSQRQGDTIHSPMNCLPGAGWEPVSRTTLTIPVAAASHLPAPAPPSIDVNRYVIRKGADKMLVVYWYQSQGRVIASEYASKVFMVWDAMRTSRTDAALVRVLTPYSEREPDAEDAAERRTKAFVQAMFPRLSQFLPS